ncbi:hypothetical protein [Rhizobium tibeticum]|uniref:hypothetical protein n=1 Tax=Rhizobium tibeticum TaxID=501024 RepID=UPI001160B478|nr:hypothetical protein [Rhizobium tibeticum]
MIRPLVKLALILSVFVPSAAHAIFVTNYASWKKFQPAMQEAYLVGVMDGWTRTSTPGEPPWMKAQRTGINKCLKEQEINSTMLVDLVDSHYRTYTADWRLSPALVVKDVVMRTCLADVNSEREKAGFSPWERKAGQISRDN